MASNMAQRASNAVRVSGVRWTTTINEFMEYFAQFGNVEKIIRPINLANGYPKYQGIVVRMRASEDISRILKQKVHVIEGKNVYVQKVFQKPEGRNRDQSMDNRHQSMNDRHQSMDDRHQSMDEMKDEGSPMDELPPMDDNMLDK